MKLVNKCILSRFIAPGFRLAALRADSHEILVMCCPFVTLCCFTSEIERNIMFIQEFLLNMKKFVGMEIDYVTCYLNCFALRDE